MYNACLGVLINIKILCRNPKTTGHKSRARYIAFDLQGDDLVWYARPQLFFNCTLCPTGAMGYSYSHKKESSVYFSTFEPIELTQDSIMQQAGVPMLYDSANNPRLPCLYICPVTNLLGCAPSFRALSTATVTLRFHTWATSRTRRRLCRHAAGPGQRQQALLGKRLDVALRPGPPPDGVYC